MIIQLDNFNDVPREVQNGALTIGNFDGVHRGHQAIIDQVKQLAQQVSGPSVAFTFDPSPAKLLRPNEAPAALTEIHRRAELLNKIGIDHVVVCKTTPQLLQLEPEEFFERVILQTLKAKAVAEGENFCFGKQRRGDVVLLKQLCKDSQIKFSILEPQRDQGDWISSTRIRTLIESGDMVEANRLLIEPYRISGTVGHGAARGRTLGFPTANIDGIAVLCPPLGVYAGRVVTINPADPTAPNPVGLPAAINIGANPTFGESTIKVEAHIVGFDGDIYDRVLGIELLDKLRDVQKFESKDQLLAQLAQDIQRTSAIAQR